MNTKIIGSGHYLPSFVLTNDDISKFVETDNEWIIKRTGIHNRHIAKTQNTTDLAFLAAEIAINDSKISPKDIDLILVGTMTPDFLTPSVSSVIAGKLGAINAGAMDINVACSGFVYALDVADSYIKSGKAKNILLVCAEKLSRITNFKDRNTCILFGDGASALVLSSSKELGVLSTFLGADGNNWKYLTAGKFQDPDPIKNNDFLKSSFFEMSGSDVLRFAVRAVPKAIDEVLKRAEKTIKDIDWIVPHQANIRIIDNIIKNYGLAREKVCVNLDKYGNTSSASIGICLDEYIKRGEMKKGQLALLVGFGGGLSFASAIIKI